MTIAEKLYMNKYRLLIEELTSSYNDADLNFITTAKVYPLYEFIGQEKAIESLRFGLLMKKSGYNIYIAGLSGTGRTSYSKLIIEKFAKKIKVPNDWVYVYNFEDPQCPKAIGVEAGLGAQFKKDIEDLVKKLRIEIPLIFERNQREIKKTKISMKFQKNNRNVIRKLEQIENKYNFKLEKFRDTLNPSTLKYNYLTKQNKCSDLIAIGTRKELENFIRLDFEMVRYLNQLSSIRKEYKSRIKKLDEQMVSNTLDDLLNRLVSRYKNCKEVLDYINSFKRDVIKNLNYFKKSIDNDWNEKTSKMEVHKKKEQSFFNRYKVNLLISNENLVHAPIINASNISLYSQNNDIEYRNKLREEYGGFMQIKPGLLHIANGGFLIIDANKLMNNPTEWETLKMALKAGNIAIECTNKLIGYIDTSTLIKPEPIPLDIKVILIGNYKTYHSFLNMDQDFTNLFKVKVDYDIDMAKEQKNILKMIGFIANRCKKEKIRHLDREAVGRIIEYSSRIAEHKERLTCQFNKILEIIYEADIWAENECANLISGYHVDKAIKEKKCRENRHEIKLKNLFKDGILMIDLQGEKVGQINGLMVTVIGEERFGKPIKITANTYRGRTGIVNIERETKKSGSMYDKGFMILKGYLGYKYAQINSIALSGSISYEQSHSTIDGDSGSSAELYVILSSISGIPIKQSIAVTGSINQKGEIQSVSGINEKIEGFYNICSQIGLTGEQGVIIPRQNIKHLMLSQEVIDAVADNQFHIYAIDHLDQGIEILTGIPAGHMNEEGIYPEGTINYIINKQLSEMLNR